MGLSLQERRFISLLQSWKEGGKGVGGKPEDTTKALNLLVSIFVPNCADAVWYRAQTCLMDVNDVATNAGHGRREAQPAAGGSQPHFTFHIDAFCFCC